MRLWPCAETHGYPARTLQTTASRHWEQASLDFNLNPAKRCLMASAPCSRAIYGMV